MVFLTREDGSPTADVREMDQLLQSAWAPVNRKYAERPEPCLEVCYANDPQKGGVSDACACACT